MISLFIYFSFQMRMQNLYFVNKWKQQKWNFTSLSTLQKIIAIDSLFQKQNLNKYRLQDISGVAAKKKSHFILYLGLGSPIAKHSIQSRTISFAYPSNKQNPIYNFCCPQNILFHFWCRLWKKKKNEKQNLFFF